MGGVSPAVGVSLPRSGTKGRCLALGLRGGAISRDALPAETPSAREDDEIAGAIEKVFQAHRRRYGSLRIHQEPREVGGSIGRKWVERLMRREGLMARTRQRFRPCKATAGNDAVAENVLNRQFQPSEPNRCWAGDITSIRTTEGWRYLAELHSQVHQVMAPDVFFRPVVGWKPRNTLDASLVTEALEPALGLREVKPDGAAADSHLS